MKTKTIITAFAIILLGVFFSACNNGSKKDEYQKKELTASEALDTCFMKIAELQIFVDSNRKFSSLEFNKQPGRLLICYAPCALASKKEQDFIMDSLSSHQKTKNGFKKISIYRLRRNLTSDEIKSFIQSKNAYSVTVKDLFLLFEQNANKLPIYTWILGGDFNSKLTPHLYVFDKSTLSPTSCFTFAVFETEKDYKWKAPEVAVAYYTTE